jgi:hypothetical protein
VDAFSWHNLSWEDMSPSSHVYGLETHPVVIPGRVNLAHGQTWFASFIRGFGGPTSTWYPISLWFHITFWWSVECSPSQLFCFLTFPTPSDSYTPLLCLTSPSTSHPLFVHILDLPLPFSCAYCTPTPFTPTTAPLPPISLSYLPIPSLLCRYSFSFFSPDLPQTNFSLRTPTPFVPYHCSTDNLFLFSISSPILPNTNLPLLYSKTHVDSSLLLSTFPLTMSPFQLSYFLSLSFTHPTSNSPSLFLSIHYSSTYSLCTFFFCTHFLLSYSLSSFELY